MHSDYEKLELVPAVFAKIEFFILHLTVVVALLDIDKISPVC